ncbi:MAG TPA: nicotinate-nucleotide--dimethylbenzimidazole phosphoribosyltransferase [Candidatus Syntrophoarchaeum butanivorans]|uniref:Nicotinate-nucleotide--dimethylbenzimidazole phosphoribosyltransferase n=1 Tax=Candidatus Syntropharchaeum butanivorans TaxID=1839936 RepID=A0A1F2P5G6_9EURY|nr:MAG: nicotinate-nucleotide--dimethylbenzimidazole phosphoribosyltransferase [Candidatus Syntrophoarchaeum butanivorans]HEC56503.1 nicotinate-nucleotide--dimethylbenzimidazole phosphoribosyltransferase [Candidatus Syntrophoarchaeum butanivorans]
MDEIRRIIDRIEPPERDAMLAARRRQDELTKPQGSLGFLEEISIKVAGIKRNAIPDPFENKVVITMAGDHGVVEDGVSAYPKEVTPQMVYNFLDGGAAINVLARHIGARVVVVDMGVAASLEPYPALVDKKIGFGTRNMAKGPAMTREEAIESIKAGIEVFESELERGVDIVALGDMGIGNTTPSSAIAAVMTGKPVSEVTGRGTGVDDEGLSRKIEAIERAISVNKPDPSDPIDILSKVGGFEIGGIAGAMLAAASNRVPVVVDGFISGAGALIAAGLAPQVKEYMFAGHISVERGHRAVLEWLGLRPILDLNLRLGEGTGAVLAIGIIEAACKILREMRTFEEAGVSKKE